MLTRRHRFHGYGSLKGVYARGKNVRGSLMSLKCAQKGQDRPYRAAVVVSRKVHKSAVTRNRIRRRVYETIRQHENLIKPGSDLVFTAHGDQLAELPAKQLENLVVELLQKAGQMV